MPQLDASSFSSQLFWLTITFLALYLLLARFLLPQVQSVMEARAQSIDGDIEQAEQMKSEAARASEQYEKTLSEARAKSLGMIAAAQAEIGAKASQRQAELDASIEKKLSESEASIRSAKQSVADKLTPVAGDLASLIVEVLVHEKPSAEALGTVMTELAKERGL